MLLFVKLSLRDMTKLNSQVISSEVTLENNSTFVGLYGWCGWLFFGLRHCLPSIVFLQLFHGSAAAVLW